MAEINEIEAAAIEAKRVREAADATSKSLKNKNNNGDWPIVPIAIGVGSAALAAALLYANRGRRK